MARRLIFASQFGVGKTTTSDLTHCDRESFGVSHWSLVNVLTIVIPNHMFIYIAKQMKRLYGNVGSTKAALKQRPEVLHAINVNLSANISFSLVNHVMHEAQLHPAVISDCGIRIDLAAKLDVLEYLVLQCFSRDVWDNTGANLTEIAVKDSLNNSFVLLRSKATGFQPAILVHVLGESANESFVYFKFGAGTTKLRCGAKRAIVHSFSEPLTRKP